MPQMRSMVAAAVKAPSSHNTQPWLFSLAQNRVEMWADRTRALPVNDPYDRELTISCGAALFNLEIAALVQGFRPMVTILPDPSDPDLLARVSFGEPTRDVSMDAELFAAIDVRHSSRKEFDSDDKIARLRPSLAAGLEGHDVKAFFDLDREVLRDLVAEGDRAQFADPHWRRELASWMHPRRKGDGLVVPEIIGIATKTIVSHLDLGSSTAKADQALLVDAPIVAVLTTDTDDTASWIETGRGLQHLLLIAAAANVSAGYLNQPCQLTTLRSKLHALLADKGFPQVIVRLGRTTAPDHRSPRRPVEDVLTITT